jgi:hypothetical protein
MRALTPCNFAGRGACEISLVTTHHIPVGAVARLGTTSPEQRCYHPTKRSPGVEKIRRSFKHGAHVTNEFWRHFFKVLQIYNLLQTFLKASKGTSIGALLGSASKFIILEAL